MIDFVSYFIVCFCMMATGLYAQNAVYGSFEGRTPCQEIGTELDLYAGHPESARAKCIKRKWALTLYYDSVTHGPTTYNISGIGETSGEGKWHIVKGTATDADAIVYKLDMADRSLFLLKGDDNVLFILDHNRNFFVGNARFSYTLNRIKPGLSWDQLRYFIHKGFSFAEMNQQP